MSSGPPRDVLALVLALAGLFAVLVGVVLVLASLRA